MGLALLLILFLPWKLIFLILLILGSFAAISAPSWIAAWIGLEINILALIALLINSKSPRNSEAALKYFLVQALASAILVTRAFRIRFIYWSINGFRPFLSFILLSLLIKIGRAPFHFWVPQVTEGLQWVNNLIVLIWQKLAPFILAASCIERKVRKSIAFIRIILSAFIGALGGLAQSSVRKILAFSSINHIGWILIRLIYNTSTWLIYYSSYALILFLLILLIFISNINRISNIIISLSSTQIVIFFVALLSFGGLPPFLGFGPKWLVISNLRNVYPPLVIFLIISSLITLFFYIRLALQTLLIKKNLISLSFYSSSNIWFIALIVHTTGLIVLTPLFLL